ncbi:uncharacterized protein Dyak_GE28112, isoform B [Drosophila yakuba]|uniref:Uncharacterized protein, isoform B n=1 Tax=Drosophila yakuba TaxID=7245 RepID=A0A0R1DV83_DROYA|nr:uncharacterized protein Dyak_GE28112, isoform B [Drosophila yakuba]
MDGTVLNADSILEIMKYVIIDCQLNEGRHVEMGIVDFNDLINFVLAHEFFVELLADHHKILYKDLELALACRTIKLLIDLRVNKQSKNEEIFWRSFLESVREKSPFDLQLSFQGLYVHIKITGISSGRTHQETLKFDLTLNADALADILSSNQNLTKLSFESTEVHGDLSDIIPHCANIEELRITLNAGDVASQYEPLVNLPNLKNILVTGLQRSESESLFFSNLKKWHRPSSLPPLTLKIEDYLTDIHRPITFATFNSLRCFRVNETKAYYERKYKWKWNAIFRAEYDLSAMKDDSSSIEDSLATIRLGEGVKIKFIWSEGRQKLEYLNTIFDAFAANLSTIEELNLSELRPYRSELKGVRFKDISKVTEIQTIRSLRCCVSDVTGVQKLADLNKLENLEIYHSGDGNLIELLTKLAEKNTIKCIKTGKLTHEEVLKITQMRSMKTLVSRLLNEDDLKFFAELANSSIEEIIIMEYNNSIWVTPSLFYTIRARQLGHFDIWHKKLNFIETVDVSKITGLKRLCAGFVDAECAEILDRLPQLEDLTIGFIKTPLETLLRVIALKSPMTLKKLELCNWIGGSECECLTQFETLESLTCSLRNEMGIDHLANIQNLKELLIHRDSAPLTNLFRAFAQKSDSKLEKLQAPVTCSAEIREISQIKSLKTLNVDLTKMCDNLSNLSRLNELKSLSIIDSCGCKLNSDSCLSIFRYCQKLNRVDLGFYYGVALDLVSQVNNVLKSIRDPANQKPLKLSIFSVSIYPKIHVEDIDESILNVSYSYETKMGAVEIEFNSDNEDSDDSDSFDYD